MNRSRNFSASTKARIWGILLVMVGWLSAFLPTTTAAPPRPNILLILADDLGFSDLGCYGGEIRTPNLDGLAKDGLRFAQFYNCARCCPSRASLLTGLYPHQAGVGSMTGDQGKPGYRGFLQPNCVTLGQVLKSAGYHTAAAGKWHVGDNIPPTSRGFDEFYGWVKGYAVDSWEPRMMIRLPEGRPQHQYAEGQYFATDAITDHALDFIAAARDGKAPWFLYLAYQAPHFPLQTRAEDAKGYAEIYAQGWDKIRAQRLARQKELGAVPANLELTPRSPIPMPKVAERVGSLTADGANPQWDTLAADRRADLAQRMATYAGMVTGMDRNIGRVIADLKAHGELERTLILFLSDNGACAEWEPFGFDLKPVAEPKPGTGINLGTPGAPNVLHRGEQLASVGQPGSLISYGSAWANTCNTPWRWYKHYGHEGGISSPFIVHWPQGVAARGEWRTQPGHIIDVMATLVDVAGAKYPKELDGRAITPMEGRSLLSAFNGSKIERDFLAWEHEGNRAIRQGDWKLVAVGGQPWELYDLAKDRTELNDLAAQNPDKVKALSEKWEQWATRTQVLPRPGNEGGKKKAAE